MQATDPYITPKISNYHSFKNRCQDALHFELQPLIAYQLFFNPNKVQTSPSKVPPAQITVEGAGEAAANIIMDSGVDEGEAISC